MALELFKNNISTTLAVGINSSVTTITVATGTGANFPALSGGNYFRAVLTSSAVPGSSYEYLIVTAVSGDNLTVIRGQEGVAAASWNAGDIIYMTATAASDANFAQAADLSAYAPIASPTFTGNPTAPTPTQFDNDTSLATTEFVQRALGQLRGYTITSGLTALGVSDVNKIINVSTGSTITLPATSGIVAGCTVLLFGTMTSSTATIAPASGDSLVVGKTTVANLTLGPGDSVLAVYQTAGAWLLLGTAQLGNSNQFASSLASSGYQKLPSGLIVQWGVLGTVSPSGSTWTFPIVFPNAALRCFATSYNNTPYKVSNGVPTTTGVTVYGETGSISANLFAIGY